MTASTSLLDLPNECISVIFSALDADGSSPFARSITDLPGIDKIPVTPTTTTAKTARKDTRNAPLKSCSILSRRLRHLALPFLLRHAFLNPPRRRDDDDDVEPFLAFITRNALANQVVSVVVAYFHDDPSPCNDRDTGTWRWSRWYTRLFGHLPHLRTISILAPPQRFADIMASHQTGGGVRPDSWAFDIEYQIISLSTSASRMSSFASSSSSSTTTTTTTRTTQAPPSLMDFRPWTSFTLNESSSLSSYNTYEYFLRRPPSPMHYIPPLMLPSTTMTMGTALRPNPFLANLRSFSYIAVFPTWYHVVSVLLRVRQMTNLRRLFIKLLPQPDSTLLHDALANELFHLDVNDPWTEFEASLSAIASLCSELGPVLPALPLPDDHQPGSDNPNNMNGHDDDNASDTRARMVLGRLEVLEVDDVKMEGLKNDIERRVNHHLAQPAALGWRYEGNGIWRRKADIINGAMDE